jgi:hypothetical protein
MLLRGQSHAGENAIAKAIFVDDISSEKVDASLAATPLIAGGRAGPSGPPATTDDYLLTAFNLDAPGMEKVKAAVQARDLASAQAAYLDYRRTASPAKWKIMPSNQPAAAVERDDPLGDDVAAHKIHNLWYDAMQPKIADMGANFEWFHNPLPPTDPNYTTNWMGCVISRTQFWENLADAYWKTRNEKYAQAWVWQLQRFATKVPLDYDPIGCSNPGLTPIIISSIVPPLPRRRTGLIQRKSATTP